MRTHRIRMTRAASLGVLVAALLLGAGCETSSGSPAGGADTVGGDTAAPDDTVSGDHVAPTPGPFLGEHVHTMRMGQSDNAEVIKAIPGKRMALLVSSKARKVTLLRVGADRLETAREAVLFENDSTESELTHVDVSSDGSWAVATRTLLVTDGGGAQTDCGGELVFFDATDSPSFGTVLKQVAVGPMPDSVDISDDDTLVVSADERDGPDAWGKCEVPGETASISVVDVTGGPAAAALRHQIAIADTESAPREPESIVFSADNDLVFATLQDSHEVLFFRVSALAGVANPTTADVTVVRLPDNALGAGPWPDGVTRFVAGDGVEYFATAGEWNDTFCVLKADGTVVANVDISARDLPESLPRVIQEDYPLFSPDSIVPFHYGDRSYLAFTLRHAGAVAVYDVTDATAPAYRTAIAVGDDETGGKDEDGSTIRPEGIAAAADGAFLLTANEEESSVSLIVPAE